MIRHRSLLQNFTDPYGTKKSVIREFERKQYCTKVNYEKSMAHFAPLTLYLVKYSLIPVTLPNVL